MAFASQSARQVVPGGGGAAGRHTLFILFLFFISFSNVRHILCVVLQAPFTAWRAALSVLGVSTFNGGRAGSVGSGVSVGSGAWLW